MRGGSMTATTVDGNHDIETDKRARGPRLYRSHAPMHRSYRIRDGNGTRGEPVLSNRLTQNCTNSPSKITLCRR